MMAVATLTAKGQIVIPAEIRARHELTPGTQVEFVDEGGVIRLLVRRRFTASEPAAGYGMIRIEEQTAAGSAPRRLSDFDPAALLKPGKSSKSGKPRKAGK
jgi:AbrB family looped-hinge helix DNA binding protein